MARSTRFEPDEVADFLRNVRELDEQVLREDALRAQKLQRDILEGRRQRQAMREVLGGSDSRSARSLPQRSSADLNVDAARPQQERSGHLERERLLKAKSFAGKERIEDVDAENAPQLPPRKPRSMPRDRTVSRENKLEALKKLRSRQSMATLPSTSSASAPITASARHVVSPPRPRSASPPPLMPRAPSPAAALAPEKLRTTGQYRTSGGPGASQKTFQSHEQLAARNSDDKVGVGNTRMAHEPPASRSANALGPEGVKPKNFIQSAMKRHGQNSGDNGEQQEISLINPVARSGTRLESPERPQGKLPLPESPLSGPSWLSSAMSKNPSPISSPSVSKQPTYSPYKEKEPVSKAFADHSLPRSGRGITSPKLQHRKPEGQLSNQQPRPYLQPRESPSSTRPPKLPNRVQKSEENDPIADIKRNLRSLTVEPQKNPPATEERIETPLNKTKPPSARKEMPSKPAEAIAKLQALKAAPPKPTRVVSIPEALKRMQSLKPAEKIERDAPASPEAAEKLKELRPSSPVKLELVDENKEAILSRKSTLNKSTQNDKFIDDSIQRMIKSGKNGLKAKSPTRATKNPADFPEQLAAAFGSRAGSVPADTSVDDSHRKAENADTLSHFTKSRPRGPKRKLPKELEGPHTSVAKGANVASAYKSTLSTVASKDDYKDASQGLKVDLQRASQTRVVRPQSSVSDLKSKFESQQGGSLEFGKPRTGNVEGRKEAVAKARRSVSNKKRPPPSATA